MKRATRPFVAAEDVAAATRGETRQRGRGGLMASVASSCRTRREQRRTARVGARGEPSWMREGGVALSTSSQAILLASFLPRRRRAARPPASPFPSPLATLSPPHPSSTPLASVSRFCARPLSSGRDHNAEAPPRAPRLGGLLPLRVRANRVRALRRRVVGVNAIRRARVCVCVCQ